VNKELAASWEKEMKKRNDYFTQYSIPVVTFADSRLAACGKGEFF
jgi:hypothetical protein